EGLTRIVPITRLVALLAGRFVRRRFARRLEILIIDAPEMTAARGLPLPHVHQISRRGIVIAETMSGHRLTGQWVRAEIRALSCTESRRARDTNGEFVLIEVLHIRNVDAARQVVPAVCAFNQRCASQ